MLRQNSCITIPPSREPIVSMHAQVIRTKSCQVEYATMLEMGIHSIMLQGSSY